MQRCVMGVGMSLYAQLVQTNNKQCKSAASQAHREGGVAGASAPGSGSPKGGPLKKIGTIF